MKKLVIADLSNIEGRMLSWVAQEQWKLTAFRAFDAGSGPDLYNVTAASILGGDPYKVSKTNRNVFGKVPDLASGYMGGVAGYQTFARAYNVRMADYWETICQAVGGDTVDKAQENFAKWGHTQLAHLEIGQQEWLASEMCKLAWRKRHPATVAFWYALQDAAKNAINEWGTVFEVEPFIKVKCVKHKGQRWLLVKLPSGRYLTYFDPRIEQTDMGTGITYMGDAAEKGKTTRQWTRVFTHGGKMTGNCCQTLARDILAPALLEAEQRGYVPVLSIHDEGLTETPDTPEYSAAGLVKILSTNPPWAEGLPLAAAGFETYRYYKD